MPKSRIRKQKKNKVQLVPEKELKKVGNQFMMVDTGEFRRIVHRQ